MRTPADHLTSPFPTIPQSTASATGARATPRRSRPPGTASPVYSRVKVRMLTQTASAVRETPPFRDPTRSPVPKSPSRRLTFSPRLPPPVAEQCVGDWCEGFDEDGYPSTPDVAAAAFARKDDHCVGDWCEDDSFDDASGFDRAAIKSQKDHCVGDWCEDTDDTDASSASGFPFPSGLNNLIPKDLAWTSDPKFAAANASLLVAETALLFLASTVQPITTGELCGVDPTAFGCLHVGAHQAFADEIGAAMVAVALSYTGFVTLLAAENFGTCAKYLLDRGVPRTELEGVSSYRFVRGAEAVLRRTNDVDAAVAYLRDVRDRRGHFVRSFSSGAKTYTPWWKNAPAPPVTPSVTPSVAENKSNVVAFRRSNKPGAIDDEKVFEKVSSAGRSEKEKKPFPTGTLPPRR